VSINRVPEVPFAQIANEALRDKRLSFRARGVLAMVLSNAGEWTATRDWIVSMSDVEGREAIQTALNELTKFGYRQVESINVGGKLVTVVEWFHQPQPDGILGDLVAVRNSEHHKKNTKTSPADAGASENFGKAFADTFADQFGKAAPTSMVKRVARDATAMVKQQGIDSATVAESVRAAAKAGHANVGSAYLAVASRGKSVSPYAAELTELQQKLVDKGWHRRKDGNFEKDGIVVNGKGEAL
jgi:hypothetical protein